MSLRIGLYDFFAYTIPGVFYVLIMVYGLSVFGFISLDLRALNHLSLFAILLLVGTGYVVTNLLDLLAYKWYKLFHSRYSSVAFEQFKEYHPWLELKFQPGEWRILLYAIRTSSIEVAEHIDQHNVASIMLRNISLGLLLASVLCLVVYYSVGHTVWNLLLSVALFGLSVLAIQRSGLRRRWFYADILEAYAAHHLLQGNWAGVKLRDAAGGQVIEAQQVATSNAALETSSDSAEVG